MNLTGSLKASTGFTRSQLCHSLPSRLSAACTKWPDLVGGSGPGFALSSVGELISLPAWYSCRVAPIDRTPVWRLLATHIMAAQILSLLWVGAGKLIARALAFVTALQGIDARFDQRATIVYGAGCVFYLLAVSFHYVSMAQDASREFERRAWRPAFRHGMRS